MKVEAEILTVVYKTRMIFSLPHSDLVSCCPSPCTLLSHTGLPALPQASSGSLHLLFPLPAPYIRLGWTDETTWNTDCPTEAF